MEDGGPRTHRPGDEIALLVSRTDPDRVHQVGWDADTAPADIPVWFLVAAAVGIVAPLLLPGPRRRLRDALTNLSESSPAPTTDRRR